MNQASSGATVIRLRSFVRVPYRARVPLTRAGLMYRDRYRCAYCGAKADTIDHVVPRSQGGQSTWDNIVCACVSCNVRKGGRTPKQAHMSLIRKPEKPKRSPLLNLKLTHRKYQSWRTFLDNAYWSVELK